MYVKVDQMKRKPFRFVAQSAMEYLMTYGWAILIIAVVLAALFELGVFNGSNLSPQACIAQSGFVCKNPVYTSNGIIFTFGQTTGRDYYGDWVFVASQGEALNSSGIPVNFTCTPTGCANAVTVGLPGPNGVRVLVPGQTVTAVFPANAFPAGAVPSNPPIGTPFAGYIWLGYCLGPCTAPTAYSKVATITIKSAGVFAGSTTTLPSSTTTTTTSSTSTTTISGTPCTNNWPGGVCVGAVTYTSSMDLSDTIRVSGNVVIDSGVTLTTDGFAIISGGMFTNDGTIITGQVGNGGVTNGNGGVNGGNVPDSYGGSGGGGGWSNCNNGGAGGNTLVSGGAGGSPGGCNGDSPGSGANQPAPAPSIVLADIPTWYANGFTNYYDGAGGGTCSCTTSYAGSGGYGIYIQAAEVINNNVINADGYSGCPNGQGTGAGQCSGCNGDWCWNAGAGGGGFVILAYESSITPGTIDVSGGNGYVSGNYQSGGNGGPGQYIEVPYSSPPIPP